MDEPSLRARAIRRLLASGWVRVPGVVGIVSLLLAVLTGQLFGLLGAIGVAGILFALGTAFTLWVIRSGPLMQAAYREMLRGAQRGRVLQYAELERQFRLDRDPRLPENVRKLRLLAERLDALAPGMVSEVFAEVVEKARRLHQSCLDSLQRAAQHGAVARTMATEEARNRVLESRGQLLDEVSENVDHLGASIDQLQLVLLEREGPPQRVTEIRGDLDRGLEVARRVHERMAELEQRLGPTGQRSIDRS